MIYRISVSTKIPDARADHYRKTLKGVFPTCKLDKVSVVAVYTVDVDIPRAEWGRAAARLANPTTEHYSFGEVPAPAEYAYAVEIGFLPGVTDNVAHTAREALEDGLGRKFTEDEAVYSSYFLFLTGNISKDDAQKIARELSNPLIERASIYEYGADFPLVIPKVHLQGHAVTDVVDLDIDDDELTRIGKEGSSNRSRRRGRNTASTPFSPTPWMMWRRGFTAATSRAPPRKYANKKAKKIFACRSLRTMRAPLPSTTNTSSHTRSRRIIRPPASTRLAAL